MDARLISLNAFIALVSPQATSWPNLLYEIGYRLEGLEIPVSTGDGRVVIDCIAFDAATNRFLLAESKSGNNIEVEQARRYKAVDPKDLIRLIGVTITKAGEQSAETMYLCLTETVERILLGLKDAECAYPVLAIGSEAVSLVGARPTNPAIADAFAAPVPVPGPPPGIVLVDDQSGDDEFDALVAAAMVAEVTQGRDVIPCPELASRAIPHLHIFGTGHRRRLVRLVTSAAQRHCRSASDILEYRGPTQSRDYAVVKVIDSPERSDPRGRTQRYQALKAKLTGAPLPPAPGEAQGSLFDEIDLAAELDKADTSNSETDESDEEDR